MRQFIYLLASLFLCVTLHSRPTSGFYTNPEMDELRIELDDLKHALNTTQTELEILDERLKKQGNTLSQNQGKDLGSMTAISSQISSLEKKVFTLEKTLEKAAGDLRTLSASVSQTLAKLQNLEIDLTSHDKRLEEVTKLKGTLTSISKAISQRSLPDVAPSSSKSYRVKAGDSLEKIARVNHISVDSLRKINHIANDKIVIGQELRLSDDP